MNTDPETLEELRAERDRWKSLAGELAGKLTEFIEHVEACNESDLLACDSDPHPPSVFSAYADEAIALTDKLLAMEPKQ